MTSSTPQSSKKLATRRDCTTPCRTSISQGGARPMPSSVPNTYTSVPSATQYPVTLVTAPTSSNMKFGQFSEELGKWIKEMLESEKDFVEMVIQLNATDRMVFQNVSRLECLHNTLINLGKSQADVNSDLNRTGCELLMIEEAVQNIERRAEAKPACQDNQATRTDTALGSCSDDSTLYNFMLQMNLDLKYLTERLADVINASNYPRDRGVGTGPVMSIGYILNYHYECLVDIEDAYVKCKTALENLQKIQSQISSSGSMNC